MHSICCKFFINININSIMRQSIVRNLTNFHRKIHSATLRQVAEVVRFLKKSGSLANRSTSVLSRGVGCQHDISPTTNQPPRAGAAFTRKERRDGEGWRGSEIRIRKDSARFVSSFSFFLNKYERQVKIEKDKKRARKRRQNRRRRRWR